MYRQGDVLLVPVDPKDLVLGGFESKAARHRKIKGLVLAEGEATGHHHRVVQRGRTTTARLRRASTVKGNRVSRARVLIVPKGGAELVHDEHSTIKLPAGTFLVQGQREFVPAAPKQAQRERRVFD